uniref:Uncharacterized protein n=1 Tax=Lepeophtheirus salmonis TaxID=72036 RepID=A0A0K2UNI6_LEPSM
MTEGSTKTAVSITLRSDPERFEGVGRDVIMGSEFSAFCREALLIFNILSCLELVSFPPFLLVMPPFP